LFPHINSRESPEQLEEERRLCYVGITRAKEHLYLTLAKQRLIWGTSRQQRASRFLKELPLEYIEVVKSPPKVLSASSKKTTLPKPIAEITEEFVSDLSEGQLISHQMFGIGVVQKVSTSQLGLMYKILFSKDNKERTLIAKLAKLTKL
ncbi:MAG: ATP-dependent DNA helicase, partial [Parachlamydiaceae bacterium]|nr:ATP-dependent DNA helicase [Parachlamydiaceae bacterium]